MIEFIEGDPLKARGQPAGRPAGGADRRSAGCRASQRRYAPRSETREHHGHLSGSVKLLDFGIAGQFADADATATLEGTVVPLGTAAYMSPEQIQGKTLDGRSDIFSFGAVLHELLSGRPAFQGDTPSRPWRRFSVTSQRRSMRLRVASASSSAASRSHLAQRYQTMAELRAALTGAPPATLSHSPPSIAVLPFANLSADKEQEYFSDGLAEEIINLLAQIPGLKVIARTSAFAFNGKTEDIRKIAGTLDVTTFSKAACGEPGRASASTRSSSTRATAIISGRSAMTAKWRTCSTCRTKSRRPSRPRCK